MAPGYDRRSRSGKALAFQQIGKYVAPLARLYQAPRRDLLAAFVDTEISAVHEPDLWPIVSEQRHLLCQLVRPPSVVTVEEGDEGRAARLEGEVARVRGAAWLAGDDLQIGAARRVLGQDARRRIGRPVVDHDHRPRRERLREHAVEAGRQEARAVAHRNEYVDVDPRHARGLRLPSTAGAR